MKTKIKRVLSVFSVFALSITYINCPPASKSNDASALLALLSSGSLCGDITSAQSFSGNVELCGIATVKSGGSITFAPGTTVKAFPGSYILVLPGGKIFADGTAGSPIVFTSGIAVGSRAPGDWGGIVIIGRASGAAAGDTEGVNPQPYGLTVAAANEADNSGILNYVRIEFAGNEVASGDELNGLSLYGVGTGTTISYVQVHRGLDDGIEAWGGSVNMDHILVTGGMDDDIDLDEAYAGTINTLITHKYPVACGGTYSSDPRSFEMDGFAGGGADPVAGYRDGTYTATITNFTAIGIPTAGVSGSAAYKFREGFHGNFSNGIFMARNNSSAGNTQENTTGSNETTVTFAATVFKTPATSTSVTGSPSITGSITDDADADITEYGESSCEFTTTPNYTLINASINGGNGADGQWYSGWTYYRAN
ncbi:MULTISPECIES: hypothetical protein [unclassified Leptospira]|uniref:hypothetical protein n=1 Tax=unclassified Leptospira TaxID=2633828 RepID=UPI0002BD5215|nr:MULTISPECIES: hypothetical protein [unclassified Leptospira]EMJ99176.1 hypothetical protein LEP1GSC192_3047 [Leptospira sp. B5-022]MCR1795227.1 hypothetical protein [Leptospira sp. id769339]